MILAYIKLLRPKQWLKNIFVLAGFLFAREWQNLELLKSVILCFISFCVLSSAVYCMNDIVDADLDRKNPKKCNRPIATGEVKPFSAVIMALLLVIISVGTGFAVGTKAILIISCYLFLNVLYSFWLKHLVLIDVFSIAVGFMLRVTAGTWGVDLSPSNWLLLCTFSLSLYLGFSKRYAEINDTGIEKKNKRKVLGNYSLPFLRILLSVTLSASFILYALYTTSQRTLAIHQTDKLIYTLPIVIFGLCRYLFLVMTGKGGQDTANEILFDFQLILTFIAYGALVFFIILKTV